MSGSHVPVVKVGDSVGDDVTVTIEDRIQLIESKLSGLGEWKRNVTSRLDRVEEVNNVLRDEHETLKIELNNQIQIVRDQYTRLSNQTDKWSVFKFGTMSLIAMGLVYYILNLWHLLFLG